MNLAPCITAETTHCWCSPPRCCYCLKTIEQLSLDPPKTLEELFPDDGSLEHEEGPDDLTWARDLITKFEGKPE